MLFHFNVGGTPKRGFERNTKTEERLRKMRTIISPGEFGAADTGTEHMGTM